MTKRSEIAATVRDSLLDYLDNVIDDEEIDEVTERVVARLEREGIVEVEEDDPDYEPSFSEDEDEENDEE